MAKKSYMKGGALMVWYNTEDGVSCIALSTSCKIDESASVIDPETKDDSIYQQVDPDGNRWTVQCDFQIDEDMANYKALFNLKSAHSKLELFIAKAGNYTDNGVDGTDEGRWELEGGSLDLNGYAYITSLTMQGDKGSKATGSVTFSGCSVLNCEG